MTGPSPLDLLTVPPSGIATSVELTDRRTQTQWSIEVAPFLLAPVPVTAGFYGKVTRHEVPAGGEGLPAVDVSWREAVAFCNDLSVQHGLTSAYRVEHAPVESAPGWAPHHRPAPDDVLVT